MIDYGGCTTDWIEKDGKRGLRRRVWSPRFCRQKKGEHHQMTSAYWDFEELMVTVRCIELMTEGKTTKLCHQDWSRAILSFMKLMRKIVPRDQHLTPKDDPERYDYIYKTLSTFCRRVAEQSN